MNVQNITQVPLGGKRAAGRVALIDSAHAARVLQHKWSLDGTGRYANARINGKTVLLHRFIMNPAPGQQVDHINGDGLDCREQNMRLCTTQQNSRNRSKTSAKSGYKGVHRRSDTGRYSAYINHEGKRIRLGDWETAELAARAYATAAREVHGEFAKIQAEPFPQSLDSLLAEIAEREPVIRERSHARRDSRSGIRGITWSKQGERWKVNRKGTPKTSFKLLEDAKAFLAKFGIKG